MARVKNAASVAEKWKQRFSASGQQVLDGVNAVTTAPTQQAAAALPQYLAGVQAAVQSGRMERALNAVSLQDWQNSVKAKTLPRLISGATDGAPKMQKFMQDFLPVAAAASDEARNAAPRDGGAGSLRRVQVVMERFQQFKQNRR